MAIGHLDNLFDAIICSDLQKVLSWFYSRVDKMLEAEQVVNANMSETSPSVCGDGYVAVGPIVPIITSHVLS